MMAYAAGFDVCPSQFPPSSVAPGEPFAILCGPHSLYLDTLDPMCLSTHGGAEASLGLPDVVAAQQAWVDAQVRHDAQGRPVYLTHDFQYTNLMLCSLVEEMNLKQTAETPRNRQRQHL